MFDYDGEDKASLRERVFRSIREAILQEKYKKGDALREAVIAKELNVSRTPVREAIRQLELEGLVYSIPNKETVVAGVTKEDVEDIFLIRSKLEGLAARKAALSISSEALEAMKETLELTAFYIQKKDIDRIGELDHNFHDMIYKATESKIFNQVLSDFHTYIQKTRQASLAMPGRMEGLLDEHTAIYKALLARDADESEHLMNKHIQAVSKNMHLCEK